MKKQSVRFWFSCKWDGIRAFFLLVKRLPGFYRMNRFWDADPQFYTDVIRNYSEVMSDITGNRLSKPSHDAQTVLMYAWDYIDEIFREREEEKKAKDQPESST